MNNELVVDVFEDREEDTIEDVLSPEEITSLEQRRAWLFKVVETLRALKKTAAFKKYRMLVIDPDIRALHHRLTQERDAAALHTYQGSVVVLEKYFDVDLQLIAFEKRLERINRKVEEKKETTNE